MPVKRQYHVKGTNDFLVLAAIFFFLGIWAVKDGWFPSEKVLKKHPPQVEVAFEIGGAVDEVKVVAGEAIAEDQVLAELQSDSLEVQSEEAKKAYTEAKAAYAEARTSLGSAPEGEKAEWQERIAATKEAMDAATDKVHELRSQLEAMALKSPNKGEVKEILIAPYSVVEAGQTAIVIVPDDHFYLFNKSLTVVSLILVFVFLGIHILGR